MKQFPKYVLLSLFSFFSITLIHSQKKEDSKIVITVKDTVDMYEKVRTAFVRSNFLVKDLNIADTIITYPTEFNGLYTTAFAIFNNNTVTLSGRYSLKKVDYFGYNSTSKDSKRIIYYKGSKTWRILMEVAKMIGGDIFYSE